MNKSIIRTIITAMLTSMPLHAGIAHPKTIAPYHEEGKEQQDTHRLTIKECMMSAIDNSLKIKSQQTLTEDAQNERIQAILQAFTPSISAGTQAYLSFGRSVDPETNTYVSTASFNNGYSVSGGITLFNGFEAVNNIRIAATSAKMGADRRQQITDELCLTVMEAYCNVVYYSKMSEILDIQVTTAKNSLVLAQRQEELGQKGHADVLEMQAGLADAEYQYVKIRNLYEDALISLKNLMYWPLDEELHICTDIADPQTAILLASPQESVAAESEEVLSRLPSVAIARSTMENAGYELKKAKWRFSPRISLSAGWSTSYYTYPGQANYVPIPYMSQLRNNSGEYIQVSLSIPLYDRLGNIFNLKQKKNARTRSTIEYEQALRDVKTEMARAVQDRDGAVAAFIQADRRAEMQEEAYYLNIKKLEHGLISPLEFQKASDNWLNANAERLNALLNFRIKRSVVSYYNGIPYQEQEWH